MSAELQERIDMTDDEMQHVVGGTGEIDDLVDDLDLIAADDWNDWSMAVGEASVPHLEALAEMIPGLQSVMLCTADGFNLCCLGVDEDAVGRLAALSSSLHTVAGAAVGAVRGRIARQDPLELVSLVSGHNQMIVTSLEHKQLGHLLLWCSADDTMLGVMVVAVRKVATRIRAVLEEM